MVILSLLTLVNIVIISTTIYIIRTHVREVECSDLPVVATVMARAPSVTSSVPKQLA